MAESVLQIAREQKPETVRQLIDQVRQSFPSVSEKEIRGIILRLQNEDKLHLVQKQAPPTNLRTYLRSGLAAWYWLTLAITLVTVACVLAIPENAYPYVIVRYILGGIFVLWLPGYTFIKTLFPAGFNVKASDKDMDIIERIALSVGMSLALTSITGLLLNYTPWGIRLTPITLSLMTLALIFSTVALAREYQSTKNSAPQTGP